MMKKLTLGLIAGAVAGAVLAYLTEAEPDPNAPGGGSPQARIQHTVRQLRSRFEGARAEAHRSRATALAARPAGGSTAAGTPAPTIAEQLKSRWRAAVNEGRAVSAEKQAELRRKYLEDTRRM